jgi:hypothetical protein
LSAPTEYRAKAIILVMSAKRTWKQVTAEECPGVKAHQRRGLGHLAAI